MRDVYPFRGGLVAPFPWRIVGCEPIQSFARSAGGHFRDGDRETAHTRVATRACALAKYASHRIQAAVTGYIKDRDASPIRKLLSKTVRLRHAA